MLWTVLYYRVAVGFIIENQLLFDWYHISKKMRHQIKLIE